MSKKFLRATFLANALMMSSLFAIGSAAPTKALSFFPKESVTQNAYVKNFDVEASNLEEDIESLSFYVDFSDQTINYDITFKDSSFDGTTVNSFYFYAENETIDPWIHVAFNNSQAVVDNQQAQNKASYEELFGIDLADIYSVDGLMSVGVDYEKDGGMVSATKNLFRINVKDVEDFLLVDKGATTIVTNEEVTFADINFTLFYDDEYVRPEVITLKSKTDPNLTREIFNGADYDLIQGENTFNIKLEQEYRYSELYLEFIFKNFGGASYVERSDFAGNPDFISGIEENNWSGLSVILFIIILALTIVVFFFIAWILIMMGRRKRLEQANEATYFDQHHS